MWLVGQRHRPIEYFDFALHLLSTSSNFIIFFFSPHNPHVMIQASLAVAY